jgi:hypothetical protein
MSLLGKFSEDGKDFIRRLRNPGPAIQGSDGASVVRRGELGGHGRGRRSSCRRKSFIEQYELSIMGSNRRHNIAEKVSREGIEPSRRRHCQNFET